MKFTLKDYQEDAVKDVLNNLGKVAKRWHEDGDRHAFSLTATTGAGKTVMAAAVFEALFRGDDNFDFEADRWRCRDLVQRRSGIERPVAFPPARGVGPSDFVGSCYPPEHLQPRETGVGEGLFPQHAEAEQIEPFGAGVTTRTMPLWSPMGSRPSCPTCVRSPSGIQSRTLSRIQI